MPGQGRSRLKKGEISLLELYKVSNQYYQQFDNKRSRANIDITSAKIVMRNNLKFNRKTNTWEQEGREIKFIFSVVSDPKSYKKTDKLKKHIYPVTFLLKEFSIYSAFRFRTGSLKMPKFAKKGTKTKDRQKITEQNIRNGIQLNFFFHCEWVLSKFGLLWGHNRTNGPPVKTNPKLVPFYDKTSLYVLEKLLFPILRSKKAAAINRKSENPQTK